MFNPCCCTTGTCDQECCNGGKWPDQINCDLSLGWVDAACDACETLDGVYVLNYDSGSNPLNNCIWTYDSGELCNFPGDCSSGTFTARARLLIVATLTTGCNWSVNVDWFHSGLDDSCDSHNKFAVYTISDSGDEDCDGMTLSKSSESTSDNYSCSGSFPATIELSR